MRSKHIRTSPHTPPVAPKLVTQIANELESDNWIDHLNRMSTVQHLGLGVTTFGHGMKMRKPGGRWQRMWEPARKLSDFQYLVEWLEESREISITWQLTYERTDTDGGPKQAWAAMEVYFLNDLMSYFGNAVSATPPAALTAALLKALFNEEFYQ